MYSTIVFTESLSVLDELIISDPNPIADTVASTITETQQSLQTLFSFMSRNQRRRYVPHAWTTEQLQHLYEQGFDLPNFEINFPLAEGKWVSTCPVFTDIMTDALTLFEA